MSESMTQKHTLERLQKQQASDCTVPPKSKTGHGLNFVINQEKYLRVFLKPQS